MDELLRLSPVMFARHISIEPDDWQKDALKARDREIILNCCRQSGKSTTAAIARSAAAWWMIPGSERFYDVHDETIIYNLRYISIPE